MHKSYIIINTPRSCSSCKFGFDDYENEVIKCFLDSARNIEDPYNSIPNWCRLNDLPEERKYREKDNSFMQGCAIGWNDLLKVLLRRNF